jgi:hypothetical protein
VQAPLVASGATQSPVVGHGKRCGGGVQTLLVASGAAQPLSWAALVYCDNFSVVYLSTNLIKHQCTEHVEIDLHFVRKHVAGRDVLVLYVPMTS